jgi:hypothetical protein
VRFVGADDQLVRTRVAPPSRRRTAATAFERKNKVEHVRSVLTAADNSTAYRGATTPLS